MSSKGFNQLPARIPLDKRLLICGLYAAGILVLSIMPAGAFDEAPKLFPHQDKVIHALMYGGWAVLLVWALQGKIRSRPIAWLITIVLLAAAYGAIMEILQGSLPWIERACSWGDMIANLAGAILGVGVCALCFQLQTHALLKKSEFLPP